MKTLHEVPYSLHPGDAHLTLCLNETPKGEFSTHTKNSGCGGFYCGRYFKTKGEAAQSLLTRMTTNYRIEDINQTSPIPPL